MSCNVPTGEETVHKQSPEVLWLSTGWDWSQGCVHHSGSGNEHTTGGRMDQWEMNSEFLIPNTTKACIVHVKVGQLDR